MLCRKGVRVRADGAGAVERSGQVEAEAGLCGRTIRENVVTLVHIVEGTRLRKKRLYAVLLGLTPREPSNY